MNIKRKEIRYCPSEILFDPYNIFNGELNNIKLNLEEKFEQIETVALENNVKRIEFESRYFYDYGGIKIYFIRDETDEEMNKRIEKNNKRNLTLKKNLTKRKNELEKRKQEIEKELENLMDDNKSNLDGQ